MRRWHEETALMDRRLRQERMIYHDEGRLHRLLVDGETILSHNTYEYFGRRDRGIFRKDTPFGCSCNVCRAVKATDKMRRRKRARQTPRDEVPLPR